MNRVIMLCRMVAVPLILAACTGDTAGGDAPESDFDIAAAAPVPEVTVTTTDFAFQSPDTLPAGAAKIRLVNDGAELHHLIFVKLGEHSLQELADYMKANQKMPPWAIEAGGPNSPAPGRETTATVDLDPGQYAMICMIPSGDGIPHLMKGMMREVVVVPRGAVTAAAPEADVEMRLRDYDFEMAALTAGKHTIRVVNDAPQAHEAVIVRLAPGKTVMDFIAWVESQDGPPPAEPLGGVTNLSPGESNTFDVNLSPGDYALVCFVPDAKDGQPHFVHGMVKQFQVS